MDIKQAVDLIENHPDYRLLRKVKVGNELNLPDTSPKRVGLYVDCETTGLDALADKAIELGMVLFEYAPDTGKIYRILDRLDQFEDPQEPLEPEVIRLTGITDDMVKDQAFNDAEINAMVEKAVIVIAHNAFFDRRVLERRFPIFERKAWACSFKQVPWKEEGISSGKLDYIGFRYGLCYGEHRALNDCEAALYILNLPLPESGTLAMTALLENARKPKIKVVALGSPFESKDLLKERGYRWNDGSDGSPKAWWRLVPEDELEEERQFLDDEIYMGAPNRAALQPVTPFDMFSVRE